MTAEWEYWDGEWFPVDGGHSQHKTNAFMESRYKQFQEGIGTTRTMTLARKDYKLDFKKMTLTFPDHTVRSIRRRLTSSSSRPSTGRPSAGSAPAARPPGSHGAAAPAEPGAAASGYPSGAAPRPPGSHAAARAPPAEPAAAAGGRGAVAASAAAPPAAELHRDAPGAGAVAASVPRAPAAPGAPGDPLRGLSVHYLATSFMDKVRGSGLDEKSTIRDIEPIIIRPNTASVVCPRDGRVGAAFVDSLEGEDLVGRATHMLSYTWGYPIGEVVSSLTAWCRINNCNPRRAWIWMCCFCINQHRVIEAQLAGTVVPFEDFQREFDSRVKGIGKVLAIMGSWQLTMYCRRIWCVFELYTAMMLHESNPGGDTLDILMSPNEADRFRETLFDSSGGVDCIWKALSGIRVEKAEAYVKHDRDRIMALVEKGPGCAKLNQEIVRRLHSWFAENSEGYLHERLHTGGADSDKHVARACVRVGDMLERVSKYDSALKILQKGREIFKSEGMTYDEEHAMLLRVLGTVHRRLAELEEAQTCYKEANRIHKQLGREPSNEFAQLLQDLGRLSGDLCKLDEELRYHMEALEIRRKLHTIDTPEGAGLYRSLGMVYFQKYDYGPALEFFEKAEAMHVKTGSLETPEGAAALQSIGDVLSSMYPPRLAEALEKHEQAYRITEQLGIGNSPKGVAQLRRIAYLHRSLGHTAASKEYRAKATEVSDSQTADTCEAAFPAPLTSPASSSAGVAKAVAAGGPAPAVAEAAVTTIGKDWGIYFEVVKDNEEYIDPLHRDFPHRLCSFKPVPTVGILPAHLHVDWSDRDTMTTEGRAWTLDAAALKPGSYVAKIAAGGKVTGYLSPLHAVNLPDSVKEEVGIPASAKHFMFSYPAKVSTDYDGKTRSFKPSTTDADLAFLSNGGYVYLDGSCTKILRLNAVLPSNDGGLKFGPPLHWESQWSDRLVKAGRFQPITVEEIRQTGATHFCWIRPNEVMWFKKYGGVPICPYGGFAYICRPPSEVAEGRGLKRGVAEPQAAAAAPAACHTDEGSLKRHASFSRHSSGAASVGAEPFAR